MIENILITSAGRRVSLVKSFQETLKTFNPDAKVFTCDMDPLLSSACQVSDAYFSVPKVTDPTYPSLIKEYCLTHQVSIVVPTIDTELTILAALKEEFAEVGILLVISSLKLCETFYYKDSTERFFVDNKIETPRMITDLSQCNYPLFAKLNNSSCSIGAEKVSDITVAKKLAIDPNYIFQEFIEGEEYTVDVFIDRDANVISVVPRLRIEVRTGEVNKAKTVKDPEIISAVKALCDKLTGAYGCLTIQLFKRVDNKIIFIEMNPRFGGGYPLSYLSGANFASYLIKDYLKERLSYSEAWKENLIMLRYDAEVLVDGHSL